MVYSTRRAGAVVEPRAIRILVVEDEEADAELLLLQLKRDGFAPDWTRVWTRDDYVAALDSAFDLVIADYTLPQFDAMSALQLLRARDRDLPFIVVTGSVGEERAVACMREGATDYLLKDRLARLGPAVERALQETAARAAKRAAEEALERLKNQLQAENVYLQQEIKSRHNFEELVGGSESLRDVLSRVELVANTDATVLVLGETGTGKELVARAIHATSRRSTRPLVKVNCAALSPTLVENELFGHAQGAFTGAVNRAVGRFELADGGTIFLDEIGEMPMEVQSKLLRVLQSGEFERVGDARTIRVDVRVIAATNRDLLEAIDRGTFRSDLYYRLNVFPLTLPPLRDRPGDAVELARFFAARFARKHGRAACDLTDGGIAALEAYDWPGNIRELENLIERAVIVSNDGTLPIPDLLGPAPRRVENPAMAATIPQTLDRVQESHIRRVLERTDWRVEGDGGAAQILGLNPNTLRSRMKKLGINRDT